MVGQRVQRQQRYFEIENLMSRTEEKLRTFGTCWKALENWSNLEAIHFQCSGGLYIFPVVFTLLFKVYGIGMM